MDISADAYASQRTLHTRHFVVAIGLLFALGAIIGIATLTNVARQMNTEEVARSEFLAKRALTNRSETSARYLRTFSSWTTGYQHLNGPVDEQWAFEQQNLGASLYTRDGYEGVFVVDRQATRYAMLKGELSQAPASDSLATPLLPLFDKVQAQPDLANPITTYALFRGWPAQLHAAAIVPDGNRSNVVAKDTSLLLFVDQFNPQKLVTMARSYGFEGLNMVSNTSVADGQPSIILGQTGFSLTWQAAAPGTRLLWSVLPPLALAVGVLALLMAWFFRHALRNSRAIEASYQNLEATHQALEASEERFRAVAEAASDWIWETDDQARLTYLSARFSAVTGFDDNHWLGRTLEQLLECETTPLLPWLSSLNEATPLASLRCAYRDLSGEARYCRVSARPILRGGQTSGYRGTASDITDEVAAHAQIQHLSLHDALTGLPNRKLLLRFLEDGLASQAHSAPLALLVLNLDDFKRINDDSGHPAGDALLQEVAARLRECTRDGDLVARLGGDEFAVVLCGMEHRHEIERFCARLIESLHRPVHYENQQLHVGASVGIVLSQHQGHLPEELIRCADIALYQAKADGKNTWCYFAAQMGEQIQQRRQVENELRSAIKHQQLVLHFQPRYRVDGREIVSVEALVRWQHPVEGLLGPDAFIPLAEQSDLIVLLGRWVLLEACQTARHWPEHIHVSVNLSPAQFMRSDVVKDVRDALVQSRFPARRLELEITENVMLNDIDGALGHMNALKELGVRLNMDDFGTGYSSLGYLRTYPFDGLKIDKRFIASMDNGSNDRAVVQAIINLGKAMNLTVTAEGVETEQQLANLGIDQCHEAQGYFLSRPIDKHAFARLLKAQGIKPRPTPNNVTQFGVRGTKK